MQTICTKSLQTDVTYNIVSIIPQQSTNGMETSLFLSASTFLQIIYQNRIVRNYSIESGGVLNLNNIFIYLSLFLYFSLSLYKLVIRKNNDNFSKDRRKYLSELRKG